MRIELISFIDISRYEVIDTPSDIFVIMEYVQGGELFDFIVSRGRLPPDEARQFFHQVCICNKILRHYFLISSPLINSF